MALLVCCIDQLGSSVVRACKPMYALQGRNAAAEDVASALDKAEAKVATLLEEQQRQGAASPPAKRDMPSILPDPAALHNISRCSAQRALLSSVTAHVK